MPSPISINPQIKDVSDIKLIRTDIANDLKMLRGVFVQVAMFLNKEREGEN